MPFRLAPLKKRVAPVREPWKAVTTPEGSLPSLAKEAASIGAWVPSPKIDQEETLPQIEEIADRIARRYVGGLAKLDEVQRAWRKKQDALRRKKQRAGHDQAPILPPSARDDSGSPRTHSGARTAREMRDARSPETSLSGAPFRSNSGSPPRRKNKKKTWQMRASEVEVNAPEEEEQDQETIKDVLKSGLGDLFHQKREVYHDEDPALDGARSDSLQIPQRNLSGGRMSEAEDDDRFDSFDQGHSQGRSASDVDPASSSNSMNVEDFHKVSKRSNGPRKTTVVGPMGSKKNHRMSAHRMQEAAPADDGQHERHGRELSFATCSELAKKHRLTVPMVRQSLEEFLSLDKNGDGRLSFEEFEQAIRDRCSIKADEATPMHLLHLNWSKADKDNDAEINFEEFLLWSTEHLFTEELVVADPKERYMRELARKFNLPLDQVERCYKTFLNSDSNRNGFIEEAEFRNCVAVLWNCDMEDIPATRFRQFWLEADKARLGKLSFEVFLIWYLTIGVR